MIVTTIRITASDREWRGLARLFDEAIEELRRAYREAVAQDRTATLVIRLESEPEKDRKK